MPCIDVGAQKKPGRNDPCQCGSGKKYKKCCLGADERAQAGNNLAPLSGRRVVERDGQTMLVSAGITDAELAMADAFFAAKNRGRGPAADMAEFAAPLVDATDGSPEQMEQALSFAAAFWNIAVMNGAERAQAMDELATKAFEDEDEREKFILLAANMVARHRTMFPELHRRRA